MKRTNKKCFNQSKRKVWRTGRRSAGADESAVKKRRQKKERRVRKAMIPSHSEAKAWKVGGSVANPERGKWEFDEVPVGARQPKGRRGIDHGTREKRNLTKFWKNSEDATVGRYRREINEGGVIPWLRTILQRTRLARKGERVQRKSRKEQRRCDPMITNDTPTCYVRR